MAAKKALVADAFALAIYLASASPALTGVPAHEWLGLAATLFLAAHFAMHADQAVAAARRVARKPGLASSGNAALNALILVALVTCALSGLLISGTVLPAFGLFATGYFFWGPLHAMSAKVLFALLLIHVVVHGGWIARALAGRRGSSAEKGGEDG